MCFLNEIPFCLITSKTRTLKTLGKQTDLWQWKPFWSPMGTYRRVFYIKPSYTPFLFTSFTSLGPFEELLPFLGRNSCTFSISVKNRGQRTKVLSIFLQLRAITISTARCVNVGRAEDRGRLSCRYSLETHLRSLFQRNSSLKGVSLPRQTNWLYLLA